MVFTGTLDKCKACDKTVYVVDMVSADGIPYHKNCFRCSQCNGKLAIGRYSSLDGVLFCMPHFEQHFKKTGSYSDRKPTMKPELARTPSKLSSMFSGTIDKCTICKKTAYPLEKITVEGENYHKSCFRCAKGGCFLTTSNYAALDGYLYCKPHYAQLFKEKGSYSHLTKSISIKRKEDASASEDKEMPEVAPENQEVQQEEENIMPQE